MCFTGRLYTSANYFPGLLLANHGTHIYLHFSDLLRFGKIADNKGTLENYSPYNMYTEDFEYKMGARLFAGLFCLIGLFAIQEIY